MLASATLELKALEIEIEQEKLNATIKRASSGERIASCRAALDAAAADMAVANAILARSQADHTRTKTLHASGLIAQAAMERPNTALEVARQHTARACGNVGAARRSWRGAGGEPGS